MPESRHRYLYERLGDHDFQQLVNALLAAQFPNFTPMALRQADGGIDGQRKIDPSIDVADLRMTLTNTRLNLGCRQ